MLQSTVTRCKHISTGLRGYFGSIVNFQKVIFRSSIYSILFVQGLFLLERCVIFRQADRNVKNTGVRIKSMVANQRRKKYGSQNKNSILIIVKSCIRVYF